MVHDLSFWSEPDWRRESTLSPVFVMAVFLCLIALAGIAYTSVVFSGKISRTYALGKLEAGNERIKRQAFKVKAARAELAMWRENRAALTELEAERVIWSRQLDALRRIIPDPVTLKLIACRLERVSVAAATPDTPPVPQRRYVVTMNGVAQGKEAYRAIPAFADRLQRDPEIGPYLYRATLKNMSGSPGDDETQFTIICEYQPL